MDIQELTSTQTAVGKQITQLLENFKKERVERRTVETTRNYQQKLNELWTNFKATHDQLTKLEAENKEHPYFQKNYYQQVQLMIQEFLEKINQRIQQTTTNTSTEQRGDLKVECSVQVVKLKRQLNATISALERIFVCIEENIKTPQSKAYYVQRLKAANQYWEQIISMYRKIIAETDEDILKDHTYNQIEDRYQAIDTRLQENLDDVTVSGSGRVKLPEIVLPTFDGNCTKWKQFKDLFVQLIHNRPLGSAEKMYYLKANLHGEPSRLIKHLQATGDNYSLAWKILVDRYDNPRTIVTALLTQLLSQPTVTSPSSIAIKRMHDTTKECLLALQNMEIQVKEWSPILLHLLLQKLDKESRVFYEQSLKSSRDLQSIDDFFSFLESRFQMLEAVPTKNDNKKSLAFTTSIKGHCSICGRYHKIFKCDKLKIFQLKIAIDLYESINCARIV